LAGSNQPQAPPSEGPARSLAGRHEKIDQPTFLRWYNSTFGTHLSEVREAEEKLKKVIDLIEEVEVTRRKTGCGYHAAYELVMDRRKHPEKYLQGEHSYSGSGNKSTKEDEEFEEEYGPMDAELFQAFIDYVMADPSLRRHIQDDHKMKA